MHRYVSAGRFRPLFGAVVAAGMAALAACSGQPVVPVAAGGSERTEAPRGPDPVSPSFSLVHETDPVVLAAGDIACAPSSSYFNGGLGSGGQCKQKAVSDVVLAANPTFVLPLGDTQYQDGRLTDFQKSYALSWGRFKDRTKPAPGNHEYRTSGASGYFDYYGAAAGSRTKGYYAFNIGTSWRAYAVNSNCAAVGGCGTTSAQYAWLKADLTANPGKNVLAFWHHPRYSSGEHGSSTFMDAIFDLLAVKNAELVLAGHDHNYERFAPRLASGERSDTRGLRSFVVGTGGKQLRGLGAIRTHSQVRNTTAYGALRLVLRPTSYEWKFVPAAGATFTDSGRTAVH